MMRTALSAIVGVLSLPGLACAQPAQGLVAQIGQWTGPLQALLREAAANPSPGSLLLIILVLGLTPFSLVIPMTATCLLAGALLPASLAPPVILSGLMLNTILSWSLARTVFGRKVEAWIERRGGALAALRLQARSGGFKWAFISRFIPAPFIGAPMVLASAGVPLGPVLGGTFLAMLPWSFAYAWAGRAGREGSLRSLGMAATAAVAVSFFAIWLRHRTLAPAKTAALPDEAAPVIRLESVSKLYAGDIWALRDLDLHVARGEFVLLTGPSGAGKSTLLSLLTLQARPSKGRLLLDGSDASRLTKGQVPLLRRKMGVVFQDFRLLYDRTVFENVAFALRVLGLPESEIKHETPAALEKCGLGSKAQMNPHRLSGGEQQRVAVARALVHDPGLILADEPTGNLDPETGWDVFRLLLQAHERGATVVVATHNQAVLTALNKRTIRLRGGLIESDGVTQVGALEETLPPMQKAMLDRFQDLGGQSGSAPV